MVAPQIVMQDYGRNNADLDKSSARILKGASWKKQRVILLMPAGATMSTKVAFALRGLIFPPNQPMFPMLAQGMEVGEAYTTAIEVLLAHPELSTWEYLLTVEHDNIGPPDGVIKLIEDMEAHPEYSCIGGLYWCKGEGGCPQLWGDPTDPQLNFRPQVPRSGELQEVCGTGMGFNLWRLSMFKDTRLRKPWFKTIAGKEGVGTQDLYAWSDFRKFGHRCAVDNRVLVAHYDLENDICW